MKKLLILTLIFLSMGCIEPSPFKNPNAPVPQDRIDETRMRMDIPYTLESMNYTKEYDTHSMGPTIGEGSTVYVMGYDAAIKIRPLAIGDIIGFEKIKGERGYLHRIIKRGNDSNGSYYITKGDNVRENDGKIREHQITVVMVGVWY